ncbi:hypothetical protein [Deinococcus peraridilitoris]|uniref:Uncharacterized protein n=1 Tax=Deinococcus peraridilitoris (strain DSM 19664 / LMG 22246 / CIP 109416 / KR-200) TaxID=937777 RepID=L0A7X7_DEIPD|nr:hypothetical protein [Deinococcus peraridilitoris]AFZ69539.1 hypothetical protein Deipe_4172 [Deinococcus peraridilitoris DSM 19664]
MLSQTNEDGRKRNGPPEKTDVARAKVMTTRVGLVVTGHRPVTEADLAQTEKDENGESVPGRRARHWLAVRKTRGGSVKELEMTSDAKTGRWSNPQQAAF